VFGLEGKEVTPVPRQSYPDVPMEADQQPIPARESRLFVHFIQNTSPLFDTIANRMEGKCRVNGISGTEWLNKLGAADTIFVWRPSKMASKQKAVVLLSGGLDSTVALAWAVRECDVRRAIFVGYAHKAFKMEATVVTGIAWHYKVEITNVRLPFYSEVCQSFAALKKDGIADGPKEDRGGSDELHRVWVPNRNMVFVSIAAAFAESLGCEAIVAGLNGEEAEQFPDNSAEFVKRINRALVLSTLSHVELVCPLIDLKKAEILKMGVELNVPLELIYTCYEGEEKMCGECMSCVRLKDAMSELSASDELSAEVEAKINGRFLK